MSEGIGIGDLKFHVLYPDIVRPLHEDEMAGLRQHISEHGVKCPIIVDGSLGIIDGANRARISQELGLVDIPYVIMAGLDDEAKRNMAIALNLHRRQMSVEERRLLAQALREGGATFGQISKALGVSRTTAYQDVHGRRDQQQDAGDEHDGSSDSAAPVVNERKAGKADTCRDALGQTVPPKLRDVFRDSFLVESARNLKEILVQGRSAVRYLPYLRLEDLVTACQSAMDAIECSTPYAVHHDCQGKGCEGCLNSGWLPKWKAEVQGDSVA